jgi:hypothetical protein
MRKLLVFAALLVAPSLLLAQVQVSVPDLTS